MHGAPIVQKLGQSALTNFSPWNFQTRKPTEHAWHVERGFDQERRVSHVGEALGYWDGLCYQRRGAMPWFKLMEYLCYIYIIYVYICIYVYIHRFFFVPLGRPSFYINSPLSWFRSDPGLGAFGQIAPRRYPRSRTPGVKRPTHIHMSRTCSSRASSLGMCTSEDINRLWWVWQFVWTYL